MGQNTGKSGVFYMNSTILRKTGARGIYFIVKLCNQVSGKLKHKLQAVVSVLCWYSLNLNEKTFFIFNN